jgi:hypothetical protein
MYLRFLIAGLVFLDSDNNKQGQQWLIYYCKQTSKQTRLQKKMQTNHVSLLQIN